MNRQSLFLRLLADDDKGAALTSALGRLRTGDTDARVIQVAPESFRQVPGAPFAYWVSEGVRRFFTKLPGFENDKRAVKQGLATADDFRFVRAAWEVPTANVSRGEKTASHLWWAFAKGGAYSPFYADVHLLVKWGADGAEIRNNLNERGKVRSNVWMLRDTAGTYFLRPGLTWPRRTQSGLALRAMPAGCIFADKGPAAFVADDDPDDLMALLAITNSRAFRTLVDLQMAFGSYEVGVIQRTPVPEITEADRRELADLANRAWSVKRALDTAELTSHAFVLPALLQAPGATLSECVAAWFTRLAETEQALAEIQVQIDEHCFDLYGFSAADREAALGGPGEDAAADGIEESDEEIEEIGASADAPALISALVDWLMGLAFGRFNIRLATGDHAPLGEPGPFDPLPLCSPGMLTDGRGLPATTPVHDYPIALPADGILVDDPGLEGDLPAEQDLVQRVQAVLEALFGEEATDREAELCELLGVRDLRTYLRRPAGFFADHLARYSKSRRKAPIYWPLSTASGSYTLWVYYPRLTEDTLFQAVSGHVSPKLSQVERRIAELQGEQGDAEGREASRITRQLSQLAELRDELIDLCDELLRVAGLPYKPDLNDGVQISAAPLWRLFRLPKWQKILKSAWKELEDGKYDWAHLAYAIWPDRVRDKCRSDRSLAIAHDLEELWQTE